MSKASPLFFVVSGTHGVGKTTVLEVAAPMLKEHGLEVRQFHHVTDVMPGKSSTPKVPQPPRPSTSWLRRAVPTFVKQIVSSVRDERTYMRGINKILAEAATQGQIALSDRYANDRLVDLRLHRRPLVQRIAVRIVCSLMRRPTLTILLTDDPKAIRSRKQELSETQIAWYQSELEDVCNKVGGPLTLLPVNGRDPQGVARELVSKILQTSRDCGHLVER